MAATEDAPKEPAELPGTDFTEAAGVVYPATIANGPDVVYPAPVPNAPTPAPPAVPAPVAPVPSGAGKRRPRRKEKKWLDCYFASI